MLYRGGPLLRNYEAELMPLSLKLKKIMKWRLKQVFLVFLLFKKVQEEGRLFDTMAWGLGAYLGEGTY